MSIDYKGKKGGDKKRFSKPDDKIDVLLLKEHRHRGILHIPGQVITVRRKQALSLASMKVCNAPE